MSKHPVPVDGVEKAIAGWAHDAAQQVSDLAIAEKRKADHVREIGNQVIAVMHRELSEYREGSEAFSLLSEALAGLQRAERDIRRRTETNGHR